MVFTCSGITPPKVNRFGWNLEHSKYILGISAGIFWARSAQKRERESQAKFCFFWQVKNARLYRFVVGQISRNLNTTRRSVSRWILSEHNFENFPVRGRFSKKCEIFAKNPSIATSRRHYSATITHRRKFYQMSPLWGLRYLVWFPFYRATQLC